MSWYKKSNYSLTSQDINWWSNYAQSMLFNSEPEARSWVASRLEAFDKQQGSIFGIDKTKNQFIANSIPVYSQGKKFKIGRRIRNTNTFSWDQIDIRHNSLEELTTGGFVLAADVKKLGPVELISVQSLHGTDSNINLKNQEWITKLSGQLKSGEVPYFKAIVYDANTNGLIDGHHRLEAVQLAGIKIIPAQGIEFRDL